MNQYDKTVGGGIQTLLQQAHENVGEPGAFNFAPKNEPVLKMADGGYTDDQVAQALRESMAQGFTLDQSLQGAASKFGVPQDQLSRVSSGFSTPSTSDSATLLTNFFGSDPNAAANLAATRKYVDYGESGGYEDEGTQIGDYTVRSSPFYYDPAGTGELLSGGYTAYKSTIGKTGKPIETTNKYDDKGGFLGSDVRVFTGGDSGLVYTLDAAGNILGQQEFDYSEGWKQTAAPLLQMAALAAAPYLKGAGLLTKVGAGAAFSGANAALQGKEGADLLRAAALGGATAGVGAGVADVAGKAAGEFAGNLFTNPDVSSVASQAARGLVEGGIKALPGAIATGDKDRLLTGALTGGVLGAAQSLAGDIELPFTKKQAEAGINLVRAVNSGNMMSAANAAASLINNPDITIATRAATLLKAMQSGNINAAMAAAQMLGNTIEKSSKTPVKTAEAPGGAFETSAIIDEFGDYGGTLVPGEAGESVNVFGTRTPEDISLDYFFSPEDRSVGQRVDVAGNRLAVGDQFLDDLILASTPSQKVDVTGKRLTPEDLGQRVDVTGKLFPAENLDDVANLTNVVKDLQSVDVTGRKIGDITDQTVGVTATRLPAETVTTPTTTPTTTATTTATTTTPSTSTTSTTAPRVTLPTSGQTLPAATTLSMLQDLPLFQSVFYERERQKELARIAKEIENQDKDPYEVLMEMAEENPRLAVDEVMKIIERG